jgi:hypothetical protein
MTEFRFWTGTCLTCLPHVGTDVLAAFVAADSPSHPRTWMGGIVDIRRSGQESGKLTQTELADSA